jgi:hypothetical protein
MLSTKFFSTSLLALAISNLAFTQELQPPGLDRLDIEEFEAVTGLVVEPDGTIRDRYFITFAEPAAGETPIVTPPNPALIGTEQVPFGQHSTGQDPREIEQALGGGLRVLSIYEATNAVYVEMSAEKAAELARDPRILDISPDRLSSITARDDQINLSGLTQTEPELIIAPTSVVEAPAISYNGIPGFYQNVVLEHQPEGDVWKLAAYETGIPIREIDGVELIVTDEIPAQVFLSISGTLLNGCETVGRSGVAVDESGHFKVMLYYDMSFLIPGEQVDCTTAISEFTEVVPLPVYGLSAGDYSYDVNSMFYGEFSLARENVLQAGNR